MRFTSFLHIFTFRLLENAGYYCSLYLDIIDNPEHLKYLEDVRGDDDLCNSGLVGGGWELQLLVLIVDAELMGAVAPPWRWGGSWC